MRIFPPAFQKLFSGSTALMEIAQPLKDLADRPLSDLTQEDMTAAFAETANRFERLLPKSQMAPSLWRRKMQEAWRQRLAAYCQFQLYEDLIEKSPEPMGVMQCRPDGSAELVLLNKINRDFSGLRKEEVKGQDVFQFFDPDVVPKVRAYIKRCLNEGSSSEIGIPMRRRQGGHLMVDMYAWRIQGTDSAFFRVINETLREEALKEIRIAEHVRRASTATLATFQFDGENSPLIKHPSAALNEILGYEAGELDETSFKTLLPNRLHTALATRLRHFQENGTFDWDAVPLQTKTGQTVVFDLHGRASEVDGTQYAEINFTDTDARLAAERDAAAAQKADAIASMTGRIAHNANNLLTIIIGSLSTLKPSVKDSSFIDEIIDRAGMLAESLRSLRHRTDSSRPAGGVSLNSVLSIQDIRMATGSTEDNLSQIEIQLELDQTPWLIEGPRFEILNIAVNFSKNAIEAMADSPRKSLTLKTERTVLENETQLRRLDPNGDFPKAVPGEFMKLIIEDTGAGIPEEILTRIWEDRFSTKDSDDIDRGRGLAESHRDIVQRGGLITVHTEAGKGTRFEIYFPRVGEAAPVTEKKDYSHAVQTSEEFSSPGDEVILVADDEQAIRNQFERILQLYRYSEILLADTSDRALEIARARSDLSAVIMDWRMPGMTAEALIAELFHLHPRLPILVYTGLVPDQRVSHPKLKFVTKGTGLSEILQTLRQLIDGTDDEAPPDTRPQ